jgi:WD40 repeat protein/surface antigen Omp85-like protein
MGRAFQVRAAAAALLLAVAVDARAQYFGRNKVQYDKDDVRVLATEHFDIYYDRTGGDAALTAGRLAERWYVRLSKAFDHTLRGRQPIVLYGSHRTFEQTNVLSGLVDENTGGFTEARKRRIVVPFASSLAETDHVIGHEIVHAFQYDMASKYKSGVNLPLWFIEGMAEYLTIGPDDPLTRMWMRDAVQSGKLPTIAQLSSPRLFPYRWGAALWAYLTSRFGADLPARALRTKRDIRKRLLEVTGQTLDELSADWQESLRAAFPGPATSASAGAEDGALISGVRGGGRLNLAASISPDGSRVVFLSERDQFSIDLYLADAHTGAVQRRLITTATSADFESLQYLNSAGSWDRAGARFALATIRTGRPALTILDVDAGSAPREIPVPQLDEIFSPTWSPSGDAIALSGMHGGVTDLFVVHLASGELRQLTNDRYTDLQPAWSPDGRTIAFASDRFTTDLTTLRLGAYRLALIDVASTHIVDAPGMSAANHFDPAWAPDGDSLYFVSDGRGATNVFRVDLESGRLFQVTDVATAVTGVTRYSPALSVAASAGTLVYNTFERGTYAIRAVRDADALAGRPVDATIPPVSPLPAQAEEDSSMEPVPPLSSSVAAATEPTERSYEPKLTLEGIGSPYFSAGGGAYGGGVQGGASFLFGDFLGDHQLLTSVHFSSQADETAFAATYIDRSRRWTWGATMEQAPDVRVSGARLRLDPLREDTLLRDTERVVWTYRSMSGFVAYPLNRSQRIEFSGGLRQVTTIRRMYTEVLTRTGKRVDRSSQLLPSDPSATVAEPGVALVGDTSISGPTGPLLGRRYRLQVAPAFGDMFYTSVLADFRQYLMPVRPYTVAIRVLHLARYGRDADDLRLREAYLGSPTLVRGYSANSVARSKCLVTIGCPALNDMLGTAMLVTKVEARVPVMSAFSSRVRYGTLPIDAFVFADAGQGWGGAQHRFGPDGTGRALVRSVGAGARINAGGIIFEFFTARPLDLDHEGWTFGFALRPGF